MNGPSFYVGWFCGGMFAVLVNAYDLGFAKAILLAAGIGLVGGFLSALGEDIWRRVHG